MVFELDYRNFFAVLFCVLYFKIKFCTYRLNYNHFLNYLLVNLLSFCFPRLQDKLICHQNVARNPVTLDSLWHYAPQGVYPQLVNMEYDIIKKSSYAKMYDRNNNCCGYSGKAKIFVKTIWSQK